MEEVKNYYAGTHFYLDSLNINDLTLPGSTVTRLKMLTYYYSSQSYFPHAFASGNCSLATTEEAIRFFNIHGRLFI